MKTKTLLLNSGQSVLIWVLTNMIGSIGPLLINSQGLVYEEIVLLSLIFSAPVILLLVPVIYLLHDIDDRKKRIAFSIISILVICILVITVFFGLLGLPSGEQRNLLLPLLPYYFAAQLTFFIVMRKTIIHGHASKIFAVVKSISSHES